MSDVGLARRLGLLDAIFLLVGSMIGSGIFIVPSLIAKNITMPGIYLGLWVLIGIFTLLGAFAYGELSALFPDAGGQYVFLRWSFGPLPSFLYGWTLLLVIASGGCAAVSIAFAKYLGVFIPSIGEHQAMFTIQAGGYRTVVSTAQVTAATVIIFLAWVNTRGVEVGAWIQNFSTVAKLAALLALILLAIVQGNGSSENFFPLWNTAVPSTSELPRIGFLAALGTAASMTLFTYDAWNTVTFAAAEIRDPGKNLPRALIFGTLITTLTYVCAVATYLYMVPLERMASVPENRIAAEIARILIGDSGTRAVAGVILISTLGCINGIILGTARVLYAMSHDGLFLSIAGRTNKQQVPHVALYVLGFWSAFLSLSGEYDHLLAYTAFAGLLFNSATVASVFLLRKKMPAAERPYLTWGYPVTSVLFIVISIPLIFYIFIGNRNDSLHGLFIILLGIPVYVIGHLRRDRIRISFTSLFGS